MGVGYGEILGRGTIMDCSGSSSLDLGQFWVLDCLGRFAPNFWTNVVPLAEAKVSGNSCTLRNLARAIEGNGEMVWPMGCGGVFRFGLAYGYQFTEADIGKFVSFKFVKISLGPPRTVEAIRCHREDPSYQHKLSLRMGASAASARVPIPMDESPADSELDEKIERAFQQMMDVSQDD
ncbi:unnamed protein product [Allacma fusca]|uniref:Uncharacterized protein n=1 Tax=Allacma fusca TaxID=39272 RepID=A0A8J2JHF2_9HEXA|nr:unnamed protein product [Allacma fusca]